MSNYVFPLALPGFDIKVTREPYYQVNVQESTSGKELRSSYWSCPRYKYKVSFAFARTTAAYQELQTIANFYARHLGQFDSFLFIDPTDNAVVAHGIGVGDGGTLAFQAQRSLLGMIYDQLGGPWSTSSLPRTNLLTYSQDFTNAAWTKTNTGSSTLVTAPDGTLTANKYTSSGTATITRAATTAAGAAYILSGWARCVAGLSLSVGADTGVLSTATYSTAGTYSVTIPVGATSVRVQLWGPGGNGAAGATATRGGGGGQGGDYAESTISTPAAGVHALIVGAPGAYTSWDTNVVRASYGDNASGVSGGGGHIIGGTIGTIKWAGGTGGNGEVGSVYRGGGGGGSGGTGSDGSTGVLGDAVAAVAGGGPGGPGNDDGASIGLAPYTGPGGGGGGGGGQDANYSGGAGFAGQAIITITGYTNTTTTTIGATPVRVSLPFVASTTSTPIAIGAGSSWPTSTALELWGWQLELQNADMMTLPSEYMVSVSGHGVGIPFYWPLMQNGFEPIYDVAPGMLVYVNGVLKTLTTDYTVSNGLITFGVAPGASLPVSITASYYRRVRFSQQSLSAESIVTQLWKTGSIELISVKP